MNRFHKYRSIREFLITILLCTPSFLIAQEYSYTNYDSKDGLAGSTVYCAVQDKDGFIWFGTETGLSRFDGAHFKNFTTADGLPDNEILRLFVDSKNRVWIIPFKSAICYYWKGKIYNQENDPLLRKLSITSIIRGVAEDKNGNILIAARDRYYIIKTNGDVLTENKIVAFPSFIFGSGVNAKGEFSILIYLWGKGSCILNFYNGKAGYLQMVSRHDYSTATGIIASPNLNLFWDREALHLYFSNGHSFRIPVPKRFINAVPLNDELLAINAMDRCLFFDLSLRKITYEFLTGYKVSSVLQDHEKNFWFTTMGEGVFRLGSTGFRNVRFRDEQSLLSAHSLIATPSGVYIGTDNSLLWKFNRLTNSLSKFKIGDAALKQGRVLSLVQRQQQLIVGTDNGIFTFTPHGKSLLNFFNAVKELVVEGHDLIVASGEGVFKNKASDTTILWRERSTCVFPTGKGYYIGTLDGLYEFNGLDPMPRRDPVFLGKDSKLLSSRIYAITKTNDGIYWIATYGEGIIGYKNNKIIINLREENGLTSNMCRSIITAGPDLWIGTDKGLNKVHIDGGKYGITKFTTADGLNSDIINAVCVDSGIVYVATPRGLTYFDEKKISLNSDCILHITEITVSDQSWQFDTTDLYLKNRDNNIRFQFAGISYRSGGDITYKYRLLGLDSTWKATRENFLSYPSLPSGDYEFQLVAINKFGVTSKLKRIHFTIDSLLIERTWFQTLLILAAIGMLSFLVSLYLRGAHKKEKERNNTLRKMAELEQMALRAQMNPHFIFNSLNSIQQYVIDKDIAGANKFITDFSRLIRQTLEFSSRQEISLAEEVSYLTTYLELERTRMENKFAYEMRLCDKVSGGEYHIPPMILQPFVENSIRHGVAYRKDNSGKITIIICEENGQLACTVEDNGVGRAVAAQYKKASVHHHPSKGMSVTMGRLDMLNKSTEHKITIAIHDLKDELGMASGTRVIIRFPVYQDNKF